MKTIVTMLAILLGAPVALAEGNAYRGASWGMTPDQVLAAVPDAARIDNPGKDAIYPNFGTCLVRIPTLEIQGRTYSVDFVFDAKDALTRVYIQNAWGDERSELDYQALKKILSEKYGAPFFADEKPPRGSDPSRHQTAWRTNATRIELSFSVTLAGTSRLRLRYMPASPDADKL